MQDNIKNIAFEEVANFPKLFLDYINQDESIRPLYQEAPNLEGFKTQISNRKFSHREVLVSVLKEQYAQLSSKPDLDILSNENTFTVCTGHQLNIFTGPLYVIYKIVSTINLAKKLKGAFPEYNFVPVYWMATEDHDFAEIASFNLFGKKYTWETQQTGVVGEMNPENIISIFDHLPEKPEVFYRAYKENDTLAGAVRQYMNELFVNYNLVCIDANDKQLKSLFSSIMLDELENQSTIKQLNHNAELLNHLGYKPQIHGRDINLFFKEKGLRERIEFKDNQYKVVDTNISFTLEEIKQQLSLYPDKFSPNVALRPLYQEVVLPNLAYLGGPSELGYWLQLKGIFENYHIPYPILLPRNMALVITNSLSKRMEKLNITVEELFLDEVSLKKKFIEKNSEHSLNLKDEEEMFSQAFDAILKKAIEVDASLKAVVEAEKVKTLKNVSNIEARIKKSEEKKFETAINQLAGLKEKLFPGGSQQERTDNFLNFYMNDPTFVEKLFTNFDPLDLRFMVLFL